VEDYFSYRKEKGQTGRMLCAIGWKQMAGWFVIFQK
jgi:copper oxidase (laccase) domain-containing protein